MSHKMLRPFIVKVSILGYPIGIGLTNICWVYIYTYVYMEYTKIIVIIYA